MTDEPLLAWVDIETSGLNSSLDVMFEICAVVTDADLLMMHLGPTVIINHDPLPQMDQFVIDMHTKSGLLEAVKDSPHSVGDAEEVILTWLEGWSLPGQVPLAGSTINFDRAFLAKQMPRLEAWFHYRNVDVSSFHTMWGMWEPQIAERAPKKRELHRAQEDIIDSIDKLRYYRNRIKRSGQRKSVLEDIF